MIICISVFFTKVFFSVAPDVTVNRNTYDIEEGKTVKLQCIANGKPSNFVYGWRHMFRDKVIRIFKTNSRILSLENLSYQDFGHYDCIVNNGIEDRQGILNHTNGTEVEVKCMYCNRTYNSNNRKLFIYC